MGEKGGEKKGGIRDQGKKEKSRQEVHITHSYSQHQYKKLNGATKRTSKKNCLYISPSLKFRLASQEADLLNKGKVLVIVPLPLPLSYPNYTLLFS